jgi:hypothetical protein
VVYNDTCSGDMSCKPFNFCRQSPKW